MLNKLLFVLRQYKVVASNTMYLSIIEGIRLLMPFIALPYIIHTVGGDNYGKVCFAQAIIAYFLIVVDFGLNVVAVKEVAVNVESKAKLSSLVSTFVWIRLALCLIGLVILSAMVAAIPLLRENALLIFFAYILVFAESFMMTAFFQGIQKMANITIIRGISVLFYVVTLLLIVRKESDYVFIPLLQGLGILISSLLGLGIMVKKYQIRICGPDKTQILAMLKQCYPFCISRVSVAINNNVGKLFAGFVLGMQEVGILDLAQKIFSAAMIPINMVDQAVYPHNAKNQDRKFATRTFWGMLGIGIVGAICIYFLSPLAVQILGAGEMSGAVPLCRILCIYLILCSMTYYIGSPVLVAFGKPAPFNQSVIISAVATILLYCILYMTDHLSLYMFIFAMLFSEIVILLYRMFFCLKYKFLFGSN